MVLNLTAQDNSFGYSNSFWLNNLLLNESSFNDNIQSKYKSFSLLLGQNIMLKSYLGQNNFSIYKGYLNGYKTMYQIMQSPSNTTFGQIGVNYIYQSSFSAYGINYFRIGLSSGNSYSSNTGWGSSQSYGCSEHSGGVWGVNSYNCTWTGNGTLYSAKIFIK